MESGCSVSRDGGQACPCTFSRLGLLLKVLGLEGFASFLHWFYFMHTSAGAQRVQKTVSDAQELVRSGREPPRVGAGNGTQILYK